MKYSTIDLNQCSFSHFPIQGQQNCFLCFKHYHNEYPFTYTIVQSLEHVKATTGHDIFIFSYNRYTTTKLSSLQGSYTTLLLHLHHIRVSISPHSHPLTLSNLIFTTLLDKNGISIILICTFLITSSTGTSVIIGHLYLLNYTLSLFLIFFF